MYIRVLALPLAIGAIVALATPAEAQAGKRKASRCAMATPAALDAQFEAFQNAWASKNPDTVTALFDTDAVLLATVANSPRTDHAGIRDYFDKFLKNSPVGRIDTSTIKSGCNWAARVGTWTVTLTDPANGAKSDVKARYSFLYQFQRGQWRIEHLHSSMMPEKTS